MLLIKKKILIISVLVANIMGISYLSAQISATGSTLSERAIYDNGESNDQIFYFKDNISGNLRCDIIGGSYYTWAKYNNEAEPKWEVFATGQEIPIYEEGGYRVEIGDGRNSNTHYCWLFVPKLTYIEAKVENADCVQLQLSADTDYDPLRYFNPADDKPYFINLEYNWETSTDVIIDQKQPTIRVEAPYENTKYTVTVTDKFNVPFTSELDYEAIAVKAAFKAEILKADVPHEVHDSILFASAPLEMRFTDESLGNILCINWQLGQRFSTERNPFEVFTEPRAEKIVLTVRSAFCESIDFYCEDQDSITINVMESLLEFPNAFTPNGDGINDEFRCVYRSLKKYQITIINRWGRVVYVSTDPSKGWDGNVGGRQAPPGVYFYFAEAEGYKQNEKHKIRGNIHLIRSK